uniref:Hemojuvelin BMP co-receptor n=1 Tax=Tetraodon nigroviridis TaxID=99883 RepID=H3C1D1_TETNG
WNIILLLFFSSSAAASCHILRCNSDFVAATLDLGGSAAAGAAVNSGYCSALRSYSTCTKRMARPCRGDLAYHSAVQGIEDLLIQYRCPRAGPTAQPRPRPQATLSGELCRHGGRPAAADGGRPEFLHCGVFGDPHVRTFNDDFHTCAVEGAWPLIDNDFLYVQATSSPSRGGSRATALTKITVIFRSWRQCLEQQLYRAELDHVPAAFADGSVVSGERRGQHALAVWTQNPGRHAEIRAAHIATVLVVRQSGRGLSLSVYAPRGVVEAFGPEQDLQLCVWGCPASQRLSPAPPTSPTVSTAAALAHCSALLPVRDVYQQACVFDLITSGDLNSSAAA